MPRPRKSNPRSHIKTVYAILEGECTEVEYIRFLRSKLPSQTSVNIVAESPGSARRTLFNRAKQIVKETDKDTEVWIICDVDDEGPELANLTRQTFKDRNRLRWAISNPEFAVWLVMHFQKCTRWEERKTYASIAKSLGVSTGSSGKQIDGDRLQGTSDVAQRNAANSRKQQESAGNFLPDNNPQSDVDQFVHRIIELVNEHLEAEQKRLNFASLY